LQIRGKTVVGIRKGEVPAFLPGTEREALDRRFLAPRKEKPIGGKGRRKTLNNGKECTSFPEA